MRCRALKLTHDLLRFVVWKPLIVTIGCFNMQGARYVAARELPHCEEPAIVKRNGTARNQKENRFTNGSCRD